MRSVDLALGKKKGKRKMRSKSESQTLSNSTSNAAAAAMDSASSIDPIHHLLLLVAFNSFLLRPPKLRLKLPTLTLPSLMTVYTLVLLTYFLVISGFVYDVIVKPPGIGSVQDPATHRRWLVVPIWVWCVACFVVWFFICGLVCDLLVGLVTVIVPGFVACFRRGG